MKRKKSRPLMLIIIILVILVIITSVSLVIFKKKQISNFSSFQQGDDDNTYVIMDENGDNIKNTSETSDVLDLKSGMIFSFDRSKKLDNTTLPGLNYCWFVCDGTNNTPDLTSCYIKGTKTLIEDFENNMPKAKKSDKFSETNTKSKYVKNFIYIMYMEPTESDDIEMYRVKLNTNDDDTYSFERTDNSFKYSQRYNRLNDGFIIPFLGSFNNNKNWSFIYNEAVDKEQIIFARGGAGVSDDYNIKLTDLSTSDYTSPQYYKLFYYNFNELKNDMKYKYLLIDGNNDLSISTTNFQNQFNRFMYLMVIPYIGGPDIPKGWILCDGKNGTPDFTDSFLALKNSEDDKDTTHDPSRYNPERIAAKLDKDKIQTITLPFIMYVGDDNSS